MTQLARSAIAVCIVAAFGAGIFWFTNNSDNGGESTLVLPTRDSPFESIFVRPPGTPDATRAAVLEDIDLDVQSVYLREILRSVPTPRPVETYDEAERLLGWRILRHVDADPADLELGGSSVLGIRGSDATQRTLLHGRALVLKQNASEPSVYFADWDPDEVRARRAGPFDVRLRATYSGEVEAAFQTGEHDSGGVPIIAEVDGPDVESVLAFIGVLTFRDSGNDPTR